LRHHFPEADIELIAGVDGVYEICVDGSVLFSKRKTGRFPNNGEILELLKKKR